MYVSGLLKDIFLDEILDFLLRRNVMLAVGVVFIFMIVFNVISIIKAIRLPKKWISFYLLLQMLVWGLLALKFGLSNQFVKYGLLMTVVTPISVIDCYSHYIYELPVIFGALGAFLVSCYLDELQTTIIGGITGFCIMFIIRWLSKNEMGEGDRDLAAYCGLCLGGGATIFMIILAFMMGGLFTGYRLIKQQMSLSEEIPFAPFIAIATVVTIFYYQELVDFWLKFTDLV